MKLGLIGDIHGNYLALRAVLDSAYAKRVEKLLITGDFVGYYFWPDKVIEMLDSWDYIAVRGNHEDMLAKAHRDDLFLREIDQKYGHGLRIALEKLSTNDLKRLISLPHPCEILSDGLRIMICHGSPWDTNQYIYPDSETRILKMLTRTECDLIVLGHTHYPMFLKYKDTYIINPGSVGQPRNHIPGAHWAIFDTETMMVNNFIEKYNIAQVAKEAKIREPGLAYLWEALVRT